MRHTYVPPGYFEPTLPEIDLQQACVLELAATNKPHFATIFDMIILVFIFATIPLVYHFMDQGLIG